MSAVLESINLGVSPVRYPRGGGCGAYTDVRQRSCGARRVGGGRVSGRRLSRYASTEVLENLVKYEGVHCEWAPNEKVAAEVAGGASLGGVRALVTMKHVGLNVAADVLYTQSYTGVTGGLVYLVGDDPGMHSSQNEQDTRNHGVGARVPVLEPSDSQEALEFSRAAFEISERFDVPVIVRLTTRISHGKGLVSAGSRTEVPAHAYRRDARKYVMMPGNARLRLKDVAERDDALVAYGSTAEMNRVEDRGGSLGVITSGIAYQYVREALPGASVLKLGLTVPLPEKLMLDFASTVERIAVVEESGRQPGAEGPRARDRRGEGRPAAVRGVVAADRRRGVRCTGVATAKRR